jgi:alkanesulfonate monooxygenase SsuD/methylene tetrahydromethanopterin reductase-like flavin-dependent oxidoreductase (luciferase family)
MSLYTAIAQGFPVDAALGLVLAEHADRLGVVEDVDRVLGGAVGVDRRGDRTDEYIEAMKAVWTQPLATYKGEFIEFKDAEVYPKPVQKPHPPVWVGGWMKLAAKRAGKYGEGWIPGWLSPKEMKVGCDILAQTAKENGRDPKKITIAVEKLATIAKTRDEGLQLAAVSIAGECYLLDWSEIEIRRTQEPTRRQRMLTHGAGHRPQQLTRPAGVVIVAGHCAQSQEHVRCHRITRRRRTVVEISRSCHHSINPCRSSPRNESRKSLRCSSSLRE